MEISDIFDNVDVPKVQRILSFFGINNQNVNEIKAIIKHTLIKLNSQHNDNGYILLSLFNSSLLDYLSFLNGPRSFLDRDEAPVFRILRTCFLDSTINNIVKTQTLDGITNSQMETVMREMTDCLDDLDMEHLMDAFPVDQDLEYYKAKYFQFLAIFNCYKNKSSFSVEYYKYHSSLPEDLISFITFSTSSLQKEKTTEIIEQIKPFVRDIEKLIRENEIIEFVKLVRRKFLNLTEIEFPNELQIDAFVNYINVFEYYLKSVYTKKVIANYEMQKLEEEKSNTIKHTTEKNEEIRRTLKFEKQTDIVIDSQNESNSNLKQEKKEKDIKKEDAEKKDKLLQKKNLQVEEDSKALQRRKQQNKREKNRLDERIGQSLQGISREKDKQFQNTLINENTEVKSDENTELKSKISEINSKIEDLTNENTELKSKIEGLTNENTELKSKIESLTNENTELKSKIEGLTNENIKIKSQLDNLTLEVQNLKNINAENSKLVDSLKKDNSKMKDLEKEMSIISRRDMVKALIAICQKFSDIDPIKLKYPEKFDAYTVILNNIRVKYNKKAHNESIVGAKKFWKKELLTLLYDILFIEPSNQNITNMINFFKALFTEEEDFKVFDLKKDDLFQGVNQLIERKNKS